MGEKGSTSAARDAEPCAEALLNLCGAATSGHTLPGVTALATVAAAAAPLSAPLNQSQSSVAPQTSYASHLGLRCDAVTIVSGPGVPLSFQTQETLMDKRNFERVPQHETSFSMPHHPQRLMNHHPPEPFASVSEWAPPPHPSILTGPPLRASTFDSRNSQHATWHASGYQIAQPPSQIRPSHHEWQQAAVPSFSYPAVTSIHPVISSHSQHPAMAHAYYYQPQIVAMPPHPQQSHQSHQHQHEHRPQSLQHHHSPQESLQHHHQAMLYQNPTDLRAPHIRPVFSETVNITSSIHDGCGTSVSPPGQIESSGRGSSDDRVPVQIPHPMHVRHPLASDARHLIELSSLTYANEPAEGPRYVAVQSTSESLGYEQKCSVPPKQVIAPSQMRNLDFVRSERVCEVTEPGMSLSNHSLMEHQSGLDAVASAASIATPLSFSYQENSSMPATSEGQSEEHVLASARLAALAEVAVISSCARDRPTVPLQSRNNAHSVSPVPSQTPTDLGAAEGVAGQDSKILAPQFLKEKENKSPPPQPETQIPALSRDASEHRTTDDLAVEQPPVISPVSQSIDSNAQESCTASKVESETICHENVTSKSSDDGDHQDQNSSEETRCPCGSTANSALMIACDGCNTWQHSKCMGIRRVAKVPEKYYCHICRPDEIRPNCIAHPRYKERMQSRDKERNKDGESNLSVVKSVELRKMFASDLKAKTLGTITQDIEDLFRRYAGLYRSQFSKDRQSIVEGLVIVTDLHRSQVQDRLESILRKMRNTTSRTSTVSEAEAGALGTSPPVGDEAENTDSARRKYISNVQTSGAVPSTVHDNVRSSGVECPQSDEPQSLIVHEDVDVLGQDNKLTDSNIDREYLKSCRLVPERVNESSAMDDDSARLKRLSSRAMNKRARPASWSHSQNTPEKSVEIVSNELEQRIRNEGINRQNLSREDRKLVHYMRMFKQMEEREERGRKKPRMISAPDSPKEWQTENCNESGLPSDSQELCQESKPDDEGSPSELAREVLVPVALKKEIVYAKANSLGSKEKLEVISRHPELEGKCDPQEREDVTKPRELKTGRDLYSLPDDEICRERGVIANMAVSSLREDSKSPQTFDVSCQSDTEIVKSLSRSNKSVCDKQFLQISAFHLYPPGPSVLRSKLIPSSRISTIEKEALLMENSKYFNGEICGTVKKRQPEAAFYVLPTEQSIDCVEVLPLKRYWIWKYFDVDRLCSDDEADRTANDSCAKDEREKLRELSTSPTNPALCSSGEGKADRRERNCSERESRVIRSSERKDVRNCEKPLYSQMRSESVEFHEDIRRIVLSFRKQRPNGCIKKRTRMLQEDPRASSLPHDSLQTISRECQNTNLFAGSDLTLACQSVPLTTSAANPYLIKRDVDNAATSDLQTCSMDKSLTSPNISNGNGKPHFTRDENFAEELSNQVSSKRTCSVAEKSARGLQTLKVVCEDRNFPKTDCPGSVLESTQGALNVDIKKMESNSCRIASVEDGSAKQDIGTSHTGPPKRATCPEDSTAEIASSPCPFALSPRAMEVEGRNNIREHCKSTDDNFEVSVTHAADGAKALDPSSPKNAHNYSDVGSKSIHPERSNVTRSGQEDMEDAPVRFNSASIYDRESPTSLPSNCDRSVENNEQYPLSRSYASSQVPSEERTRSVQLSPRDVPHWRSQTRCRGGFMNHGAPGTSVHKSNGSYGGYDNRFPGRHRGSGIFKSSYSRASRHSFPPQDNVSGRCTQNGSRKCAPGVVHGLYPKERSAPILKTSSGSKSSLPSGMQRPCGKLPNGHASAATSAWSDFRQRNGWSQSSTSESDVTKSRRHRNDLYS